VARWPRSASRAIRRAQRGLTVRTLGGTPVASAVQDSAVPALLDFWRLAVQDESVEPHQCAAVLLSDDGELSYG